MAPAGLPAEVSSTALLAEGLAASAAAETSELVAVIANDALLLLLFLDGLIRVHLDGADRARVI